MHQDKGFFKLILRSRGARYWKQQMFQEIGKNYLKLQVDLKIFLKCC